MISFETLWPVYERARKRHIAERRTLQDSFEREMLAEYFRRHPRRRKNPGHDHKDYYPLEQSYRPSFQAWADGQFATQDKIEKRLKKILGRLARDYKPRTTKEPTRFYLGYGGMYSTQGFGKDRYARNAAQQKVDHAEFYGLRAEVRPCAGDYEVVVWTDELGIEALRLKPGSSLREWVRLCWSRGVNPRVYFPHLPHGYEEKNGLDFFGNEKKETAGTSSR